MWTLPIGKTKTVGRLGVHFKRKYNALEEKRVRHSKPPAHFLSTSQLTYPETVVWYAQVLVGEQTIAKESPDLHKGDWQSAEYVSKKFQTIISLLCDDQVAGLYPVKAKHKIKNIMTDYSPWQAARAKFEGYRPQRIQYEFETTLKVDRKLNYCWPAGHSLKHSDPNVLFIILLPFAGQCTCEEQTKKHSITAIPK